MSVTRIKNNQITDATINAASKLADTSVTAGKLEDNLTYGSNLTITGNLTVNGATTTVSTTTTTVEDAIMVLNSDATGSFANDAGVYLERGDNTSVFMGYDGSATQFALVETSSVGTDATMTITDYADLRLGGLTADDAVSATGNVDGANFNTAGLVAATGNVTGGNLVTAGVADVTGNVTGANFNTSGLVSATGNITGGNIITGGLVDATGNVDGANFNTTGLVSATGNVSGGNLVSAADVTTVTVTATGNVSGGNLVTAGVADVTGNITGGNIITGGLVDATGNVDGANFNTSGLIDATGNITGGNIITGGLVDATGNVTGGNIITGGLVDATGNVDGANFNTSGLVAATGNITGGNLTTTGLTSTGDLTVLASGTIEFNQNVLGNVADPVANQDAATKAYVDSQVSAGFDITDGTTTQNITSGDTLTFAGTANEIEVAVSATDTVTIGLPDDVTIGNDLTVTGDLIVNGTTTTVNSTVSTLVDPIFQVGRGADDAALSSDDAKDRGMTMYYYDGSEKFAFMGWDNSASTISFYSDASNSSEVISGTKAALDAASLAVSATITATGNITGGNLITAGLVDATGNVSGGNINTAGLVAATGNVSGGNLVSAADVTTVTVTATGNVTGGNINTAGLVSATGNVTGGNINTAGLVSATGNVSGGNLTTAGAMDSATLSTTGEATLASATVSDLTSGRVVLAGTSGALEDSNNLTFDGSTLVVTGAATVSTTLGVTGNITGGNIITGGLVDATGNVDGANFNTAGLIDATGNITGGNIITGGLVDATGNVDGANFNTAGLVDATGNVTGGNLVTGGVADVTGNITGGNLITAGILSTASILESATDVVINEAGADVNFRVESDNNANMIFVDAGTDSVNIGTGTPTTDVSFKVGTTDSMMIPIGNTAQRPASGVVGMLRFSTTSDSLEQYTSADGWETVGVPSFTVIASETFDGDNSTVAFTLSDSQTTASCIVSINGVVQLPTTAYGVSGTTLTFTEAPLSGDKIEVRKITTTTTVTNISSSSGGATVEANNETEIDIKGNLMPAADSTYSIGNSTVRWTDIYVDAGTIHLGAIQLKESSGELAIFASDGTTPADITAGSLGAVSADAITSGTTNVTAAENGDVTFTIGGTGILSVDSTGIINEQSDGVGNIGNSTVGFNTVFAQSTSAQYADLAEKYEADADYEPGTVVHFGGEKEVSQCDMDHCTKVAGVVSTSPAYRMNDGLEAEHVAMVALTGRVPCKVQGPVAKGDMMVSAGNGKARAEADPKVGAVIGKALEDFNGEEGVIEVVIGKH
jgi:hypothetical protein